MKSASRKPQPKRKYFKSRGFSRLFCFSWEQRKLGEISKRVIVGLATSVTPYYRAEGVPILRNLNIKENYLDDSDILFLDRSYAESQISKQIRAGDVLTVHTGYIGTSCVVPEKYDKCLTFTTLITTTDNSVLKGEFLAQYLNSDIGMSAVQSVTTQGGRQNLNTNDFVKVEIRVPSLLEQSNICAMLRNIDNLITLHQRNSIGYIFKVRAYTNAWEQRKAKELFVSTADKGYPELPVLSATQDRGMIRRDENSINIFHDKKNEAGYKRVLPGQFVIHLRSFQGGFAHSAIEGITSPAYTVFGFSEPEKHDSEYWKYVFTSKSFIQRLETVTYGIRDGRSISYEEFLTLGFVYPSKAEQTAIARYLDKLSDLITLHQRERKNRLFGGKNVKQYNFSRSVLQLLRAMDTRLQRRGCSQGDYG